MQKCCFIIPYFGKFPSYFPVFLKTCAYNKDFNWLVITDDKTQYDYPDNFKVVYLKFSELQSLVKTKFPDFDAIMPFSRKLCDYKPSYGYLFEKYIEGYHSWGHCDVDTIMGNLNHFITENMLEKYDKIGCLGHFIIYRNTKENNRVFMSTYKGEKLYQKVFSHPETFWFDEEYKDDKNINQIFLAQDKKVCQTDYSMNSTFLQSAFQRIKYVGKQTDGADEHGYVKEQIRKHLYVWEKGNLYRYRLEGEMLRKEEFAYMHFQSRNMKYNSQILAEDKFKIVPNKFIPLEVEKITLDNFSKIKKNSICFQYLELKYNNLRKKLKL